HEREVVRALVGPDVLRRDRVDVPLHVAREELLVLLAFDVVVGSDHPLEVVERELGVDRNEPVDPDDRVHPLAAREAVLERVRGSQAASAAPPATTTSRIKSTVMSRRTLGAPSDGIGEGGRSRPPERGWRLGYGLSRWAWCSAARSRSSCAISSALSARSDAIPACSWCMPSRFIELSPVTSPAVFFPRPSNLSSQLIGCLLAV